MDTNLELQCSTSVTHEYAKEQFYFAGDNVTIVSHRKIIHRLRYVLQKRSMSIKALRLINLYNSLNSISLLS